MNKILLIDDNEDILFTIKEVIKVYIPGVEIFSTQSGLDGINIAKKENPDVIILDVRMPDMDGYETCKILKNEEKTNFIPIIMFSAIDKNSLSMVKGLECGADIFLRKPFENEELIAQINTALRIKKAEDYLREQNEFLAKDLKKSKNLYEDLFNSINDAIIIHDIDGIILEVNLQACALFNYTKEEFFKKKIGDIAGNYDNHYTNLDTIKLKEYFNKGNLLYETEYFDKSRNSVPVEISSRLFIFNNKSAVLNVIRNISERKQNEKEKEATIELFRIINNKNNLHDLMKLIIIFIQNWSECDAVGIRMKDGDDYPYFETKGFSDEFVQAENNLCVTDLNGQLLLDDIGNPVIECMCGNVLCGRFDPKKPFFTEFGSFWSNCTTDLLASTTEAERQSRTRNRCNGEGYESVALIPLKTNDTTYGLMQLNDRKKNRFNKHLINMIERLGNHIAIALSEKKLSNELKKSEELYRSLFENMLNGYSYCRMHYENNKPVDWTYIAVNKAFENLTGLKNITGKRVTETLPGIYESSNELFEIYNKVASSGNPERFETYVKALNKWFDIWVFSTQKGDFVTVFDVITDRKLAEEKLKESEERFRLSFENANIGMCLVDLKGMIFKVNGEMTKIFGYSKEELESISINNLALPDYKNLSLEFMEKAKEGFKENDRFEKKYNHKNGKIITCLVTSSIVRNKDNDPLYFVSHVQDITEQKISEEKLRHSTRDLQMAQYYSHVGSWIWDIKSNQIEASDEMFNIFGIDKKNFIGDFEEALSKAVHPDDREMVQKSNLDVILGKKPFPVDYRIIWNDGSIHFIWEETCEIILDDEYKPSILKGYAQDITDRKNAEEEIRKSLKEKEALLRELYHRTKNNMMVICSLLNLESFYISDEKTREILKEIENKLKSMAMVHEMLYQTKNLSRINLKKYIEDLSDLLQKSYITSNNNISFNFQLTEIDVLIDIAVPFGLVLNELITNSLKYAFPENKKGEISISINKPKDDEIDLFYSDNGIGVPEDFNILNQTTLGIQTIISIVREQMQGEISFKSKNGLNYFIRFKDNIYKERV